MGTCVSLTVFILAGQPGGGQHTPASKHWLSAALACCVGAAALAVLARWGSPVMCAGIVLLTQTAPATMAADIPDGQEGGQHDTASGPARPAASGFSG